MTSNLLRLVLHIALISLAFILRSLIGIKRLLDWQSISTLCNKGENFGGLSHYQQVRTGWPLLWLKFLAYHDTFSPFIKGHCLQKLLCSQSSMHDQGSGGYSGAWFNAKWNLGLFADAPHDFLVMCYVYYEKPGNSISHCLRSFSTIFSDELGRMRLPWVHLQAFIRYYE